MKANLGRAFPMDMEENIFMMKYNTKTESGREENFSMAMEKSSIRNMAIPMWVLSKIKSQMDMAEKFIRGKLNIKNYQNYKEFKMYNKEKSQFNQLMIAINFLIMSRIVLWMVFERTANSFKGTDSISMKKPILYMKGR